MHEACVTGPHTSTHYAPPPPLKPLHQQPPTLSPQDLQSTKCPLNTEQKQSAVRWVQYHQDYARIPGIHEGFSDRTLINYLRYRSETCRNLTVILSKLKKMGEVCGHVLCTSKYQQPSIQYQRLHSVKLKINKEHRENGRNAETNEALATGNLRCTLVLSGFDIRSARRFRPFHGLVREFIAIHIMLHGGCIRFGLFRFTDILREHLEFSTIDNCHVLRSTWRKTHKSNRAYSIKFQCKPPTGNPAQYIRYPRRKRPHLHVGRSDHHLVPTGVKLDERTRACIAIPTPSPIIRQARGLRPLASSGVFCPTTSGIRYSTPHTPPQQSSRLGYRPRTPEH